MCASVLFVLPHFSLVRNDAVEFHLQAYQMCVRRNKKSMAKQKLKSKIEHCSQNDYYFFSSSFVHVAINGIEFWPNGKFHVLLLLFEYVEFSF